MITLWFREANGLPQVTCLGTGATKNRVPFLLLARWWCFIPCCHTLPWMPLACVLQLDMSVSGKRYLSEQLWLIICSVLFMCGTWCLVFMIQSLKENLQTRELRRRGPVTHPRSHSTCLPEGQTPGRSFYFPHNLFGPTRGP